MGNKDILPGYGINVDALRALKDRDIDRIVDLVEEQQLIDFLQVGKINQALVAHFFKTSGINGIGNIVCNLGKKKKEVLITLEEFAAWFNLPTEGTPYIDEDFLNRGWEKMTGQKTVPPNPTIRLLKSPGYRLLAAIVSKGIECQGSNHESLPLRRRNMMAAIVMRRKVNWAYIIFDMIKDGIRLRKPSEFCHARAVSILLSKIKGLDLHPFKDHWKSLHVNQIFSPSSLERYKVIVGSAQKKSVESAPKTVSGSASTKHASSPSSSQSKKKSKSASTMQKPSDAGGNTLKRKLILDDEEEEEEPEEPLKRQRKSAYPAPSTAPSTAATTAKTATTAETPRPPAASTTKRRSSARIPEAKAEKRRREIEKEKAAGIYHPTTVDVEDDEVSPSLSADDASESLGKSQAHSEHSTAVEETLSRKETARRNPTRDSVPAPTKSTTPPAAAPTHTPIARVTRSAAAKGVSINEPSAQSKKVQPPTVQGKGKAKMFPETPAKSPSPPLSPAEEAEMAEAIRLSKKEAEKKSKLSKEEEAAMAEAIRRSKQEAEEKAFRDTTAEFDAHAQAGPSTSAGTTLESLIRLIGTKTVQNEMRLVTIESLLSNLSQFASTLSAQMFEIQLLQGELLSLFDDDKKGEKKKRKEEVKEEKEEKEEEEEKKEEEERKEKEEKSEEEQGSPTQQGGTEEVHPTTAEEEAVKINSDSRDHSQQGGGVPVEEMTESTQSSPDEPAKPSRSVSRKAYASKAKLLKGKKKASQEKPSEEEIQHQPVHQKAQSKPPSKEKELDLSLLEILQARERTRRFLVPSEEQEEASKPVKKTEPKQNED